MKIAHISDVHLGYRSTKSFDAQGLNVREADGYRAFIAVVDQIIAAEVDAVVVAGDVFHSPSPDIRTIQFAQLQFRRLAKSGCSIYILAGNHDVRDVAGEVAASRLLHDPERRIFSHVEPYYCHQISDDVKLHLISHHAYSEQKETFDSIGTLDDSINILSTHGSMIDPLLEIQLHTDQSPREIVLPDELVMDFGWSYILLGHIHERGHVGSSDGGKTDSSSLRSYYNGSLIRRGFSDKECSLGRGWTLWTVSSDGRMKPTFYTVPQRPQYDLPEINCSGLSSVEVTDTMLSNIEKTRLNSKFDVRVAPIVRQKIGNLSPVRHSSIDWRAIDDATTHMLSWDVKIISHDLGEEGDDEETHEEFESKDVVASYDNWIDDSKILNEIDENLREKVKEDSRAYLETSVTKVLDE